MVFTRRSLPRAEARDRAAAPPPLDLSEGWRVAFSRDGGEGGKTVTIDRLRSWVEDEETRYFSGTAVYEKEVDVPAGLLQNGLAVWLDFGEGRPVDPRPLRNGTRAWLDAPVREAAVVYVNDRRAGSVWRPPYGVGVTGLLKPGTNRFRIVVGNTAINHLAGRRLPDYRLLNLRYGERFQPQDMENLQPLPSGLLGAVRLVAK